jgi:hypothetical protein
MVLVVTTSWMLFMYTERQRLGKAWIWTWINWPSLDPRIWFNWLRLNCFFGRRKKGIPFQESWSLVLFKFYWLCSFLYFLPVIGDGDQGVRVAAATYLKNFTRRNMEGSLSSSELYKEFRDQLAQALLRVEPAILRVLIEAVSLISFKSPVIGCLTSKAVLLMTYVLYNFYWTVPTSCGKWFCQG